MRAHPITMTLRPGPVGYERLLAERRGSRTNMSAGRGLHSSTFQLNLSRF
jgi:hypothetical protein